MMIKRMLKAITKPQPYKDDYLEILRRVNAGMLHPGNLACLDYAIKNLPTNNPILEIGTFCGLSANVISYFKHIHGKSNLLFCTDKWPKAEFNGKIGYSEVTYSDCDRYVMESLERNLKFFSGSQLPYVFRLSSDKFFDDWNTNTFLVDLFSRRVVLGGSISFAYIDGNHSYEFVSRDFHNCDLVLDEGGFILFDDSGDFSNWEVKHLIKEIKKNSDYRVVMKNPNYLVQKIHKKSSTL